MSLDPNSFLKLIGTVVQLVGTANPAVKALASIPTASATISVPNLHPDLLTQLQPIVGALGHVLTNSTPLPSFNTIAGDVINPSHLSDLVLLIQHASDAFNELQLLYAKVLALEADVAHLRSNGNTSNTTVLPAASSKTSGND